jgi:hypothetical protein
MQIFPPLSNKLAPMLNASQTVSIFPKLSLDSGVNFGRKYSFLAEKTHNYSLFIVHREVNLNNIKVVSEYFLLL